MGGGVNTYDNGCVQTNVVKYCQNMYLGSLFVCQLVKSPVSELLSDVLSCSGELKKRKICEESQGDDSQISPLLASADFHFRFPYQHLGGSFQGFSAINC